MCNHPPTSPSGPLLHSKITPVVYISYHVLQRMPTATTEYESTECCYLTEADNSITHQVADHREQVDGGLLVSNIVDADLRVGHTTTVARLDEGLVLLETVATSRT